MRIFITKTDTDLQALSASLLRRSSSGTAALERVMALNPQIDDFRRLSAGTVLFIPDGPEFKARAGASVSGEGFDAIADAFGSGLESVETRAGDRFAALRAERADVAAALRTAAARRLVDADPALRDRVDAAETHLRESERLAAESEERLNEVRTFALAEFEKLQKLLEQ